MTLRRYVTPIAAEYAELIARLEAEHLRQELQRMADEVDRQALQATRPTFCAGKPRREAQWKRERRGRRP